MHSAATAVSRSRWTVLSCLHEGVLVLSKDPSFMLLPNTPFLPPHPPTPICLFVHLVGYRYALPFPPPLASSCMRAPSAFDARAARLGGPAEAHGQLRGRRVRPRFLPGGTWWNRSTTLRHRSSGRSGEREKKGRSSGSSAESHGQDQGGCR